MFDSLTPEEVYAILSAKILNTALGLGAVKGAPCTILSITKNGKDNIVTFQWTGTNGKIQTSAMTVSDGADGADGAAGADGKSAYQLAVDNGFSGSESDWLSSLQGTSVTIQENPNNDDETYRLDITDADGTFTTPNLKGTGGGSCDPSNCPCIRYTNLEGAQQDVGGIRQGDTFDNVTLQEVIDKLLSALYAPPLVTLTLSCKNMYAEEDLPSIFMPITLTANVTKRTDDIQSITFWMGDSTLLDTKTSNVANGGVFTIMSNIPITETVTFKVVVNDGKTSVVATATVLVVNSSYVGYVHSGTIVDADVVKSLTKVVKNTKTYLYDNILMPTDDTYHIVYAYPKSFGSISSIKDSMNFEYIQDYDLSELVIDGHNYYVYKLKTPVCISIPGFFQQFS